MAIGLLILRGVVGALFVGHGAQKLFGWFGGHGIEGTARFMQTIGYRNGRVAALVAGATEMVCGLLLALGFLMPVAAAGIIGVMLNAILTVHLPNGLWNVDGGMELPLVYAVAAYALAFTGPGALSLDGLLGLALAGPAYASRAFVLGVIAGLIALYLGRSERATRPQAVQDRPGQAAA